ncbi:MAG: PAS domain S-box protein [Armatimonadetes bacterium]|nr:PAS domain S-box protein [Armatimonadota bacterium]
MATLTAVDEAQRLAALHRYYILDTPPEEAFDNLVVLAARVCGAKSSILSFVDETRSWTKAGLNNSMLEIPRAGSVAARVIERGESLIVADTDDAPPEIRLLDAVVCYGVRSFAAVPLVTPDGHAIGAIGVFHSEPRRLSEDQLDGLHRVTQQVMARLELRRRTLELQEAKEALEAEVAQRRATESALADSESRWRALVEHGSDVMAVIDPSGAIAFISPSVQRILGYPPKDLVGVSVFALIHPQDRPAVQSVFARRLRERGVGEPTPFRIGAQDGHWRHFEATGTNPGPEAAVGGLIVVARDVTARVQAEEALQRREAILAAVSHFAESVLQGRSWRSEIGGALEALGRAARVTRVYVCERRRAGDRDEEFVVDHEWVAEGHTPVGRREMRTGVSLRKVGLGRWAALLEAGHVIQGNRSDFPKREHAVLKALAIRSAAVVPVRLGDDWWGFIGFGECRHERDWLPAELDALRAAGNTLAAAIQQQRMAETLEATVRDLARSNSELEQFAYVASHDLQEPLRMVQSYVELLEKRYRDQLDDSGKEFIGYALDGAERMRQLIRDLLAISRLGTRGREPAPTDTREVFDRVLRDLGEAIRESGARITHDELPTVMADGSQLAQVFQNLLSNAIKFRSDEPCRVHVGAAHRDGEWLFTVRDNGIGISPQHAERVFVPFQRLHSRREYPGTGIGLALCRRIVERHGGRLWLESRPGEGATFLFTIPDSP